jgi:hypothetical protein
MERMEMNGSTLADARRPRRDRRAGTGRWMWPALALVLAALLGTDMLMALR